MNTTTTTDLAYLRLLHLADSAFPIGALAHSFGIETLAASGFLAPENLQTFLTAYIEESLLLESIFCRAGFAAAIDGNTVRWCEINRQLHALKPGRETRSASAALGHRLLMAAMALSESPVLADTFASSRRLGIPVHHSVAFGFTAAVFDSAEDRGILAYLHQAVASIVSACQRLMPLGQTRATAILWNLKPAILGAADRGRCCTVEDATCFVPLVDWGAMEHPALSTRLFIS